MRISGQHEIREARQHHAQIDARLQDGRQPRPPIAGPRLRKQRRADGPFAADPQRGQKAEEEQLPPRSSRRTRAR